MRLHFFHRNVCAALPFPRKKLFTILIIFSFVTFLTFFFKRLKPHHAESGNKVERTNKKINRQIEYVDKKGMQVVVGKYVGSDLSSKKPDLSDVEMDANRYDPHPGDGDEGQPVFLGIREERVGKRLWHINKFNIMASDRISVNRTLPDVRKPSCQNTEPRNSYPDSSIIIVFHNEAWSTLLRTVHSVINRSPRSLLREIILVDDASNRTFLKKPLQDYVDNSINPTVPCRLIRSPVRVGLIKARLLGAVRAQGEVLVFLDAHCETTIGWLEPLLGRVAENRKAVVCPVIDIINDDNFSYVKSFSLHWGGFNWELHFRWFTMGSSVLEGYRKDNSAPYRTPVMAGGLFAMDKNFFYELGSYDQEMEIWGGENLELSFRVWMCGGSVEIAPCSHVGHVFRKASPYTFPGGVGPVLHTNLARAALVWMDDHANFYFKVNPEAHKVSATQNILTRKKLREDLKCQSFQWYLDNVWPENFFPGPGRMYGKIRHVASGLCLQRPGPKGGTTSNQPTGPALLSTCAKGFFNYQQFVYSKNDNSSSGYSFMADESVCLDSPTSGNGDPDPSVRFQACGTDSTRQRWDLHPLAQTITHYKTGSCLSRPQGGTSDEVVLRTCDKEDRLEQRWIFEEEEWK